MPWFLHFLCWTAQLTLNMLFSIARPFFLNPFPSRPGPTFQRKAFARHSASGSCQSPLTTSLRQRLANFNRENFICTLHTFLSGQCRQYPFIRSSPDAACLITSDLRSGLSSITSCRKMVLAFCPFLIIKEHFLPLLFLPSSHAPPETRCSMFPPQACTSLAPACHKYPDYMSRWHSPRPEGYGQYPESQHYPP